MKSYRPSNGSEGLVFQHRYCSRCVKDRNEDCSILASALLFHADEPEYPKEWVYPDDESVLMGVCTAFEQDPQKEPWQAGERPPFPLPGEVMGAVLGARLSENVEEANHES